MAHSPTLRVSQVPRVSDLSSGWRAFSLSQGRGQGGKGPQVPSWNRLSGMNTKKHGRREEIRYSEAFKMEVVRELEVGGIAFEDISMKYGIKGKRTVSRWVRQYGNGTRGKVIRVESPGEINELKRLKAT